MVHRLTVVWGSETRWQSAAVCIHF